MTVVNLEILVVVVVVAIVAVIVMLIIDESAIVAIIEALLHQVLVVKGAQCPHIKF